MAGAAGGPAPRVLGVDACPDGWVAVAPDPDRPRAYAGASISEVLARAALDGPPVCVGVDIPIGLPTNGSRLADLQARERLGPRRSSVFLTPVRAALEAEDYAEALARQRARTGSGCSRQAHALRTKILQVDRFRGTSEVPLLEVHPELSFATLAGAPMAWSKKTWAGAQERLRWLATAGLALPADLGPDPGRAGVDDVLDAAAAAWTAQRYAAGTARSWPDPPEELPDGSRAAIWA